MISALFIIVVLALLGVTIAAVSSMQARGSALDLNAARAYQAARAGLEWGMFQVLQVPPPPAAAPACFGATNIALTAGLTGFTVTVTCVRTGPVIDGVTPLNFYTLVANACNQGAACPNASPTVAAYAERQLTATVSR